MLLFICRPLSWIQSKKMGAFLSVAQGSQEVPWLLELRLNMVEGEPQKTEEGKKPIALVGKGIACRILLEFHDFVCMQSAPSNPSTYWCWACTLKYSESGGEY